MNQHDSEFTKDDIQVFVSDTEGPDKFVGFFEDDGVTGYLYVSDRSSNEIIKHLQIYRDSAKLDIREEDVKVQWSKDGTKCGVLIWGGMRGIIDLKNNIEGRILVTEKRTPEIKDKEWLSGFEIAEDGMNY
jgi:hypothetical protein